MSSVWCLVSRKIGHGDAGTRRRVGSGKSIRHSGHGEAMIRNPGVKSSSVAVIANPMIGPLNNLPLPAVGEGWGESRRWRDPLGPLPSREGKVMEWDFS